MREAGLIISSDLCPVTPGSSTRLSTSLQVSCNRLGQSVGLLELKAVNDGEAAQIKKLETKFEAYKAAHP
jgi:hypothetical protein